MSEDLKPLLEALAAAKQEMPSLAKADTNAHGKYSYVSIDDFLDKVGGVASKHGLSWSLNETEADLVDTGRAMALKSKYAFDLMHSSGAVSPQHFSITVLHPLAGAQTTGSSMAYALKMFLRSTFSVVTGEADADSTDNNAFSMSPASTAQPKAPAVGTPVQPRTMITDTFPADPDPAPSEPEGLKVLDDNQTAAKLIEMGMALIDNADALREYWTKNDVEVGKLKLNAPAIYKDIVAKFRARNAELGGAAKVSTRIAKGA